MTRAQFRLEKKNRKIKHFKQILKKMPLLVLFLFVVIVLIIVSPIANSIREDMIVEWEIVPAREPIKIVRTRTKPIQPIIEVVEEPIIEIETETVEDEPEILVYLGTYWITGYDICVECCGNTDGITASGTIAVPGRTIAASSDISFGTVLYIEGIGERIVEDRGGAIDGNRIDVLCNNHEECYSITGWYDVYIVNEI